MGRTRGVAQRVMDKFESDRNHTFDSDDERMEVMGHLVGAWYMHRELSVEARVILKEIETQARSYPFNEASIAARHRKHADSLRSIFQRLGLDIEGKDQ